MKTKIIIHLFILTALFYSCSLVNAQESKLKKSDLQKMNLQGKVKSVKEVSYEAVYKFGELQKGKRERDIKLIFDDKENKIEENSYNSDGIPNYTSKYDDKGNQIEWIRYNSDGSLDYKFKYDDKGNKIEENRYNWWGTLLSKKTYKYDDKGNKIELNSYKSDGSFDYKYTYKYDDKGIIIECNTYIPGDSLGSKETYKYDDKGIIIECNSYLKNGSLGIKYTYKYEYDNNENWIKRTDYTDNWPVYILEREIMYY